jgi:hypothetical protein
VREGSPLCIDPEVENGVVHEDYRPHNVENVYVTGAGCGRPAPRGTRQ